MSNCRRGLATDSGDRGYSESPVQQSPEPSIQTARDGVQRRHTEGPRTAITCGGTNQRIDIGGRLHMEETGSGQDGQQMVKTMKFEIHGTGRVGTDDRHDTTRINEIRRTETPTSTLTLHRHRRTFSCLCPSLLNSDPNMNWPDVSHLRCWLDRLDYNRPSQEEDRKTTTTTTTTTTSIRDSTKTQSRIRQKNSSIQKSAQFQFFQQPRSNNSKNSKLS